MQICSYIIYSCMCNPSNSKKLKQRKFDLYAYELTLLTVCSVPLARGNQITNPTNIN